MLNLTVVGLEVREKSDYVGGKIKKDKCQKPKGSGKNTPPTSHQKMTICACAAGQSAGHAHTQEAGSGRDR